MNCLHIVTAQLLEKLAIMVKKSPNHKIRAKVGGVNVHQAIMALTDNGTNKKALFSKACLRELGTTSADDVREYVGRYKRAGLLKELGFMGTEKRVVYCVTAQFPDTPPQLNRAGAKTNQDKHQKIWVAMRKLKRFNNAELQASCGSNPNTVNPFLQHLRKGGLLKWNGTSWNLMCDIGPLAPQILRNGQIYDPNNDSILINKGNDNG